MTKRLTILVTACMFTGLGWFVWPYLAAPDAWTSAEIEHIQSLSLMALPGLAADPGNPVASHPLAQKFGHKLFFDTRLSANGKVACATCHQPDKHFSDGLALSQALGQTMRNAPSIVGAAYSPWLYWDGRKDSLWSQALAPLEDPNEHGGNREDYVRLILTDSQYREWYTQLFGPLTTSAATDTNRVFSNIGKLIAAYERLILHGESRFDRYAAQLGNSPGTPTSAPVHLTPFELRGLDLFINEARCTQCHNGPLFTNNSFHNTGLLSVAGRIPDKGRIGAPAKVRADPFNCLGDYAATAARLSNDGTDHCAELRYMKTGKELLGAFRTPSLRNLTATAPYGHAGQQHTLMDVLQHYNNAPDAMIGHNEAKPLNFWPWQLRQLEAFLHTLQAPPAAAAEWLQPPSSDHLMK